MKNECPEYYKVTLNEGTVIEKTIECVDIIKALIEANGLTGYEAYLYGNILKYMWRCGRKGSLANDLDKAKNYLSELTIEEVIKEACDNDNK